MRYAYEAGYDVTKAPRLWRRFAQKYGDSDKVTNFFFGDHSLSLVRADNAERQLAYNFPDAGRHARDTRYASNSPSAPSRPPEPVAAAAPKPQRPSSTSAARASKPRTEPRAAEQGAAVQGWAQVLASKGMEGDEPSEEDMEWVESLVSKSGALDDTVAKGMDAPTVKVGMTEAEVKALLGTPQLSIEDTWIYGSQTIVFEGGTVKEIRPASKKG
jgi:hypothetical protein